MMNKLQAALELRRALELLATITFTEDTDVEKMMEIASIYPEYRIGVAYKIKDVFRYGENSVGDPQLYQVLQDHTSTAEWTPDTATSLYKKIGISEEGIPVWVQPLGATDAYNIGDVVMYNGQKYQSLINTNVWSPDAYPAGWQLLNSTEETPEPDDPPTEETVPEWVQPTNAADAYNAGDVVMYNGQKYQSLINANVWSPDAYPAGWQLLDS